MLTLMFDDPIYPEELIDAKGFDMLSEHMHESRALIEKAAKRVEFHESIPIPCLDFSTLFEQDCKVVTQAEGPMKIADCDSYVCIALFENKAVYESAPSDYDLCCDIMHEHVDESVIIETFKNHANLDDLADAVADMACKALTDCDPADINQTIAYGPWICNGVEYVAFCSFHVECDDVIIRAITD